VLNGDGSEPLPRVIPWSVVGAVLGLLVVIVYVGRVFRPGATNRVFRPGAVNSRI
jgi:hypothetical protein